MPERRKRRKSSRNAELSSLFTFRVTGIGGVVVAKLRTVVTFGLASGLRVSKVSTVTWTGGSWSRNPELSSFLDSPRVFASEKCQASQGSGGSWSRNPDLSSLLDSPRVVASQKCQQSQIARVVVAKPRTVVIVAFGLASGLRVSKVSTVTGIGGVMVAKPRTVVTFYVSYDKSVNSHRDRAGRGRETQNCRRRCFWTGLGSSCLKSVNSHRDRGGCGRETQNCRHVLRFVLQKCQQSQGSGGSWSRNPELSSLLDSPRVFASQKCQQSQAGIGGGSWSRNPELSSLLDSSRVVASQKCQQSQGSAGSWSRNPELSLSSLLGWPRVFASQKGIGGVVASGLRVSTLSLQKV